MRPATSLAGPAGPATLGHRPACEESDLVVESPTGLGVSVPTLPTGDSHTGPVVTSPTEPTIGPTTGLTAEPTVDSPTVPAICICDQRTTSCVSPFVLSDDEKSHPLLVDITSHATQVGEAIGLLPASEVAGRRVSRSHTGEKPAAPMDSEKSTTSSSINPVITCRQICSDCTQPILSRCEITSAVSRLSVNGPSIAHDIVKTNVKSDDEMPNLSLVEKPNKQFRVYFKHGTCEHVPSCTFDTRPSCARFQVVGLSIVW